ncbi:alcohol dehydrogenase [Immersiella caudata]|uniref:Alcohol dehydrogenase n=1 Tax=Immersiella caudata TaxID=314043 RepID=A0AA40BZJ8_9PEZI|nr:alcohol dehydrogenase [Immersiella caudata]
MTTIPPTHLIFRRSPGTPSHSTPLPLIQTTEHTLPPSGLAAHQILIRIRAVSLNYRDVLIPRGTYPGVSLPEGIPTSDCAAEVILIGSAVTRVKVGDRVCPAFDLVNLDGVVQREGHEALGGEVDGVLREWAVYREEELVKLPGHLSWEEAATISCAGVTAWNALGMGEGVGKEGKTVLIQGTGGVSLFSLLIALAAGMKPIVTSSSDEKLESLRAKLGMPELMGYNYRTHPDQAAEVKKLTGGRGVDMIIDNTGPSGFPANLDSLVRQRGVISIVGFLTGMTADWNPGLLLGLIGKTARLQGVAVGSRDDFDALNRFFEEKKVSLAPLVDHRIFDFKDSQAAFDYLWSGKHVGKVVIRV